MKNRTTKIALILLALVLATSFVVGTTLAKYTTAQSTNDSGRVAKWGVVINTDGHLFAEQYQDIEVAQDDASITVQVAAPGGTNVVAPGTRNDTGMTFVLTGTPEVDVSLNVVVDVVDIELLAKDGENDIRREDYTTGNNGDTFTLAADYYPVKFNLENGDGDALLTDVNLAAVEAFFEGMTKARIDSNTDLAKGATYGDGAYADIDGTYKLTWYWTYDGINDKADTFLGQETPLQDISFNISFTVTQLD